MKSLEALPKAVLWKDKQLLILDQRALPEEEITIHCQTIDDVFEAIKTLSVRGAPAIGIAAAYGMLVGLGDEDRQENMPALQSVLRERADYLISARPTAVNLAWAVNRMMGVACEVPDDSVEWLVARLEKEAIEIHQEDIRSCHQIGDYGVSLVKRYPKLLTHCNAGSLAVSEMGTALAPVYRAYEQGVGVHVFVDETRPLLQGARLTAYELSRVGVDCTLISDNMAAAMMSEGRVDMVLVGTDRVTANGDVANKIGTLNLAILCKHFGLPFFVACPISTIDLQTSSGAEIEIEQRQAQEVTHIKDIRVAPVGIRVENPAFDVTPAELVTGIITERGIVYPPYLKTLAGITER